MASEILRLSSEIQGIFDYVNTKEYKELINNDDDKYEFIKKNKDKWIITVDELECFSRLECIDAIRSIDIMDEEEEKHPLCYSHCIVKSFFSHYVMLQYMHLFGIMDHGTI